LQTIEPDVTDEELNRLLEEDKDLKEKYTTENEWKENKRTILPLTV